MCVRYATLALDKGLIEDSIKVGLRLFGCQERIANFADQGGDHQLKPKYEHALVSGTLSGHWPIELAR